MSKTTIHVYNENPQHWSEGVSFLEAESGR